MATQTPCVTIGVSGTSGAGKTSLVDTLAQLLNDAAVLYFDAYQATTVYPDDGFQRLCAGQTVLLTEVQSPDFARDLRALRDGRRVVDPWGRVVDPCRFAVVEAPFGRCLPGTEDVFDHLVTIRLPLEVSLARRVLRDIQVEYKNAESQTVVRKIEEYLSQYLNGLREGYVWISEATELQSDLILDGLDSTKHNAERVVAYIQERS